MDSRLFTRVINEPRTKNFLRASAYKYRANLSGDCFAVSHDPSAGVVIFLSESQIEMVKFSGVFKLNKKQHERLGRFLTS